MASSTGIGFSPLLEEPIMLLNRSRSFIAAITSFALIATTSAASADTCFTLFGGATNLQFKGAIRNLGYHPLVGVTFNGLSPCAGLSHWAVSGAAYSEAGSIVLGYRVESADAANCGAVDFTATLDPATLSGPFQLHNDRTNFSNSGTLTKAGCVAVPPADGPVYR